ncbi:hypothetical protein G3N95_29860 [Paraburkholderia sp. Tr-20389]|uniref:hypothetical protein n=1 Tax=Paraburkholderia sp. Tr-20389 TaxID=2703903 RepID=UPI00197F5E4B|nr:hypothetical protein [Paraburkholderia sp. Tr-20389]MBN3757181.1 hypothetical protein [Paraburkholderia sp. Tr-20389]
MSDATNNLCKCKLIGDFDGSHHPLCDEVYSRTGRCRFCGIVTGAPCAVAPTARCGQDLNASSAYRAEPVHDRVACSLVNGRGTKCTCDASEVPRKSLVNYVTDLNERLIAAIEGECDGLAITDEQASNILAYLQYGSPMGTEDGDRAEAHMLMDMAIGIAEEWEPDTAGGDLRIMTLRLDYAKKVRNALAVGATFEFDEAGRTMTVYGDNESIKALLRWRKRQGEITETALSRIAELSVPPPKLTEEQAEKIARELLAQEYEEHIGEGPYISYAKVARSGEGDFTRCSIRAIVRALMKVPK